MAVARWRLLVVIYTMEVASRDGNLVTGFALVLYVVGTTMLAGWNASNAEHRGIRVVRFKESELTPLLFFPFFSCLLSPHFLVVFNKLYIYV
ncbi:unnamed protein product [Camellia sinensis]